MHSGDIGRSTWRQAVGISDKILRGERPGEMPVAMLSKRELIVSLQAVKAIGATASPEVVKRADCVIE